MPDSVAGFIDYIRLFAAAVNQGRIDARDIPDMSDEGIEALITQLQADAQAEIDRGRAIDPA